MAQINPFAAPPPASFAAPASHEPAPSAIVEVSLDDDLPVYLPKYAALTALQRTQIGAWVDRAQLDDDQRKVVEAEPGGIHKVLANAGSGKTHTLVARALRILASTDTAPQQLALLTFTNRAAKEIKERFRKIVQEVTGLENPPMPYIGTIHGFSYGLIAQAEGHKQTVMTESAGRSLLRRTIRHDLYPENKEIGAEAQVRRIHATIQELCANNELHLFAWPVWVSGQPTIFTPKDARWTPEFRKTYAYVDQTARTVSMGITGTPSQFLGNEAIPSMEPELRADVRKHYASKAGVSENELITILKAFLSVKYVNRTFEFVDLLYYPVAYLSQHPGSLQAAQEKYTYIFQDEAQDQDTLQYALLRLVAGPNPNLLFCADTKQTLYFWRFARPDLTDYLDRINKPELHFPDGQIGPTQTVSPHYLRTNYRSKKQLVELANIFASGFTTKAATPAIPHHESASDVLKIQLYDTTYQENKAIARQIADLVRTGKRKFSDFAVLTHTNRSLLDLEAAFIAERVAYHLKHDNRSTTKQSTFRVAAAYYALAINSRDISALCEVLEPIKGLGDKFLLKLQTRLNQLFTQDPTLTLHNFTMDRLPEVNPAQTQYRLMAALLEKMVRPFVKQIKSGQHSIPELNVELRTLYEQYGSFDGDGEGGNRGDTAGKTFEWQFSQTALQKVCRTLDQIYHTLMEDVEFASMPEPHKVAAIHGILALGSDDSSQEDLDDDYVAPESKKDRVTLATGHAFKGKQAPVVFVSNLNGLAPPKEDPDEEARCWHYVAFTRASEQMILTAALRAPNFKGQLMDTKPNLYLEEFIANARAYKQSGSG